MLLLNKQMNFTIRKPKSLIDLLSDDKLPDVQKGANAIHDLEMYN